MVKVFFADGGNLTQLRATIEASRRRRSNAAPN